MGTTEVVWRSMIELMDSRSSQSGQRKLGVGVIRAGYAPSPGGAPTAEHPAKALVGGVRAPDSLLELGQRRGDVRAGELASAFVTMSLWELQRVAAIRWLGGTTRRGSWRAAAVIIAEDNIQLVCWMAIAGDA